MSEQSERINRERIDDHLDRFEEAWNTAETAPELRRFLPSSDDPVYHDILRGLIKIDIEYQWRVARKPESGIGNPPVSSPKLEDYIQQFPDLGSSADIPIELIAHEYRTRWWSGDAPDHSEYLERFSRDDHAISDALRRIDRERSTSEIKLRAGAAVAFHTTSDKATKAFQNTVRRDSTGHAPKTQTSMPENFGDYEILGEIARGGMGVVYRARQVSLNRTVALKVIGWGALAGDEEVRRFRAEAEAAAQLDHPNIVPIYEVGRHDAHHFFTMALVEGESLSERVSSGPLPPLDAAKLVETIANAIQYAHERGIVHRDIKPGNVLLAREPDRPGSAPADSRDIPLGSPKITDFGLAKRLTADEQWTASGQVMGTPGYMPPEQAEGRLGEIGPESDVYSLGATFYCLLTGRPPFQAATPIETLKHVIAQEPVSPRQLNPAVSRDLETICLKCLEKLPSRRYHSAGDLAADLKRYIDHKPILARPISSIGRLMRWYRRNSLPAIAATLVLASLLIGFVGTLVGLREARAQEIETGKQRDHAIEQRNRALVAEKDADAKRLRAEAAEANAKTQTAIATEATRLANKRFEELKTEAFKTIFDRLDDAQRLRNGLQLRNKLATQALEQLKRLADDPGQATHVSSAVADAYMRLAVVQGDVERLSLQKFADSIKSYQAALKILTGPSLPKETERVALRIARCRLGIAQAMAQLRQFQQAHPAYDDARKTLEKLLSDNPNDAEARAVLVKVLLNKGMLFFTNRRTAGQSTAPFQDALRHIDLLLAAGAADERTLIRRGMILFQLGVPMAAKRQIEQTLAQFAKARDAFAVVARNNPRNLRARAELVITNLMLAVVAGGSGKKQAWRLHIEAAANVEFSMVDLSVDSYVPVSRAVRLLRQTSLNLTKQREVESAVRLGYKAAFLYEELTAFHPDNAIVRLRLSEALTRQALLLIGQGRNAEGYDLLHRSQRVFLTSYHYDIEFEPIRAEHILKGSVLYLSAAMDSKGMNGRPRSWEFRQRQIRRAIEAIRASRNVNHTLREHLETLKKPIPKSLPQIDFLDRVLKQLDLVKAEIDKNKEPSIAMHKQTLEMIFTIIGKKLPKF